MPRCRSRGSASLTRSDPTGRAAEHGRGVDCLTAGHAGEPPAGAGAQIARALGHHGQLRAEDVSGGQQPGVQGHRLQVTAECLTDRDRARQPAEFAQLRGRPGEPGRERAAVQHHVRDRAAAAAFSQVSGQDRGQRRVQVGHHDRHPAQVVGIAQDVVVGRARLVCPGDDGLQRRVPGLDQVAGRGRVGREAIGHGHDQRISAGAEAQVQGGGVEQHPVARPRGPGQRRVGQCADRLARHRHLELQRAGPRSAYGRNLATSPPDHSGRVASVAGKGRPCPGGRPSDC